MLLLEIEMEPLQEPVAGPEGGKMGVAASSRQDACRL
jgi:hypothetical protein